MGDNSDKYTYQNLMLTEQIQRAPLQPQSVPRAAWHQSIQVGGKLKKKKNANKKQKK